MTRFFSSSMTPVMFPVFKHERSCLMNRTDSDLNSTATLPPLWCHAAEELSFTGRLIIAGLNSRPNAIIPNSHDGDSDWTPTGYWYRHAFIDKFVFWLLSTGAWSEIIDLPHGTYTWSSIYYATTIYQWLELSIEKSHKKLKLVIV